MVKLLCAFCLIFFSIAVSAEFFGETDIPLMDGMKINESDTFSFDVPAGQITGFTATSNKSKKEIQEFYKTTLEELGWQKKSATLYQRDQDELVLQITAQKQGTIIKIQYSLPNR